MDAAEIVKWLMGLFAAGLMSAIGGFLWWTVMQFTTQRGVNRSLSEQHNTSLAALENKWETKLEKNSTHPNDFAHAQELWQLNYDHTLELLQLQNKDNQNDHKNIVKEMAAMHGRTMQKMDAQAKSYSATIADLADKIERLALCVEALEKGEKC